MAEPDRRSIYLVGFMGSGKSTVGRALADETGLELIDADAELERRRGETIAALIARIGEPAFREAERELFDGELAGRPAIVATGGGLTTSARVRRTMRRTGRSVWLDLSLDACAARVGGATQRPIWPAADRPALRALFERRRAVYALADHRVDAAGSPAAVARRVLAVLGPQPAPPRQD